MPYEKVVLTDGTEVLFAVPEELQETEPPEAQPSQRDTTRLLAAIAPGKARRWEGAA